MKSNLSKILSTLLCIILIFSIGLPVAFAADTPCDGCTIPDPNVEEAFTKGSGTADDPWQIENVKQLNHVRQHQHSYYIQMDDLDFGALDLNGDKPGNFDPISVVTGYNGNGRKVIGLKIEVGENTYGGLFAFVDVEDIVKNLTLEGGTVCGGAESRLGGLAGENRGTIEGCINKNNVTSNAEKSYVFVGGIAGHNDKFGKIQSCENYGSIQGKENNAIAGIAGINIGRIDNCINSGNIGNLNSHSSAAGIAGYNSVEYGDNDETHGIIQKCTNEGTIEGDIGVAGITLGNERRILSCINNAEVIAKSWAAGIARQNSGIIEYCTNTGEVTSADIAAGGVVCLNGGESAMIRYCRNLGKITGGKQNAGDYQYIAGLAGDNAGTICESYNAGEINGQCFSGGLVQYNRGIIENCYNLSDITLGSGIADKNEDTIKYCYNTGHVSHGGIAGHNNGTILKSYYKQQKNIPGVYEPWGNANYNATSLTQEQMKQVPSYQGWDFDTVWSQAADKNGGYPILRGLQGSLIENAYLWELKVNGESIQDFSPSTTVYTVYLPFTVWTASIDATPLYGNSTIMEGTGTVSLSVGENLIHVIVRAKDGDQKVYNLTINRAEETILPGVSIQGIPLTPGFDVNKTRYTANVPYTSTSILLRYTPVNSGETSKGTGIKKLHTGNNTFSIKVTQANRKSKTYQVKIYRDKPSSNNKLAYVIVNDKDATPYYNPKPWPGIKYGADANTNVETARIRAVTEDPTATILSGTGDFPLKYGYNYFEIAVKAQNGSKRIFHVRVSRYYPAGYNYLASLSVSNGTLTPDFTGENPYYNLQLDAATPSVRITVAKAYAETKLSGAPVTVKLKPGQMKTIKIRVSSGGGYMVYTITVMRARP